MNVVYQSAGVYQPAGDVDVPSLQKGVETIGKIH